MITYVINYRNFTKKSQTNNACKLEVMCLVAKNI